MTELKLPKLPDRTPVKFTITVAPELAEGLREYAAEYQCRYGVEEPVAELIPYMLAAFIENDAGFKKAKREKLASTDQNPAQVPPERRRPATESTDAAKVPTG